MMKARDLFPLGIASGKAFCNRQTETKLLVQNIQEGKHSLLIAPRRYGKSSLALHSIDIAKLPYCEIDFFLTRNEKNVETYILNGITELIGKTLGPVEKSITLIKRYVKNLKPKLDIGNNVVKLELTVDYDSDPASNVKEALLLLEQMLAKKQSRAVLFFDEFQVVGLIAKGTGIEAAIRHVAQKTKYLTIIFSGSSRRLLKTMFEDDTRPLYKLCCQLSLKRIPAEHYQKQLQKAAKMAWKTELTAQIIEAILFLTNRHPYYLNKLCDLIWTYYEEKAPSREEVIKLWAQIIEEEKSDAVKEVLQLSPSQKELLYKIALSEDGGFTSKQTIIELKMSSSTILAAITGLIEKDIVEEVEDHRQKKYQIIDPVISSLVLKNYVDGSSLGEALKDAARKAGLSWALAAKR
jgi:uncharacterized protein